MRTSNVTYSIPSEGTNGIPAIDIRPAPDGMSIEAKHRLRTRTAAALTDGMPDVIVV